MATRLRALAAVLVLGGFYLLTVLTAVALLVGGRMLGRPWGSYLAFGGLALAVTTVVALVRVGRVRTTDPVGIELTADRAPRLVEVVHDLGARVGTRPPDRIVVVPEVNASVRERARLLGLRGGPRTLTIGMPLLQTMTAAQLRAVLAHEMGHYSRRHTRLGPVVYRGVVTMASVIHHVGPQSAMGRLLSAYARGFLLFAWGVRRRQEIEADRTAAAIAGPDALASALAELPGLDELWSIYLDRYVGSTWWAGQAPDRIFGAFQDLVVERGEELRERQAKARSGADGPRQPSRWDSHPPLADRIAYLATLTDAPAVPDDGRAADLVPDLDDLAASLDDLCFSRKGHTLVPWRQYTVDAARVECEQAATAILVAFAQPSGAVQTTHGALLDAVGTADFQRLVRTTRTDGPSLLATVLADCAVRSGVARWTHSWAAGPARLSQPSGAVLDIGDLARRLADPATAEAARAELAALGIKVDHQVPVPLRHAAAPRVVGLVVNVMVGRDRRDLIIYDRGLALVPGSPRTEMNGAEERLRAMARRRAEEIGSNPDCRYLPFDSVDSCARTTPSMLGRIVTLVGGLRLFTGGGAFAFELTTRDGERIGVRWGLETSYIEDSYAVLNRCLDLLAGE